MHNRSAEESKTYARVRAKLIRRGAERELLGPPRRVPGVAGSPIDGFGSSCVVSATYAYYLGSWSGLGPYGFDSAFLYIHLDGEGRVLAAEITGG